MKTHALYSVAIAIAFFAVAFQADAIPIEDLVSKDAVVPESDDLPLTDPMPYDHISDESSPTTEFSEQDDSKIQRAQLCPSGNKCTYELHNNANGLSQLPNEDVQLQRELHQLKYTVFVKPLADVGFNSKLWEVRGLTLITADKKAASEKGAKDGLVDRSSEFSRCAVRAIQDSDTGHIRATLVKARKSCPQSWSSMLVRTVHTLNLVTGSTKNNKGERFEHREDVGDDKRHVVYNIHSNGGNRKTVKSKIMHRHYNEVLTSTAVEERFVPKHHTDTETVVDGDSVKSHKAQVRVNLSPIKDMSTNLQKPGKEPELLDVPSVVTGGPNRYDQRDHFSEIKFTFKRLSTTPADHLKDLTSKTVNEFVQSAKTRGYEEKTPTDTPSKRKNRFAEMSLSQLVAAFKKLARDIPGKPDKIARIHADEMMEVPAAHQILLDHFKHLELFPDRTSSFLLAGMGRARPMPLEGLMEVANNDKLPSMPREQALWALLQSQCAAGHHMKAVEALAPLSAVGTHSKLGIHTVALHAQHALVASTVRCSRGADLDKVVRFVQPTEAALLQSLHKQDWSNAAMYLIALGNSKLPRHAAVIQKVLAQGDKIPTDPRIRETIVNVAHSVLGKPKDVVLSQLNGDPEDKLEVKWDWSIKFPKTPTNGGPKPKFQAGPKFELGINSEDGAYGKISVIACVWGCDPGATHEYEVLSFQIAYTPTTGKPIVTIALLSNIVLYTNADGGAVGANEDDATVNTSGAQVDKVGYCGTDLSSLHGGKYSWKVEQTFLTTGDISFAVGPVPLSVKFELKGGIGFDSGVGVLGGGKDTFLCREGPADKKACSTTTKCGTGKLEDGIGNNGALLFIQPFFSIEVDGSGGLDLGVIAAGIGLRITLLEVKLPMTMEVDIGGITGAQCTGLALSTEAGAGHMYLYFDSWFTGRKEWDIIDWVGAKWKYPSGGQLLGECSPKADVPPVEPAQIPNPSDTECQVVFYPDKGFSGDVNYVYVTSSGSQSPEEKSLPADVQDAVKSVKTFGNCVSAELVDDDYGSITVGNKDNSMIFDVGSIYELPFDLSNDIRSVFLTAHPPHEGKPKPLNDWTSKCTLVTYEDNNNVGWLSKHVSSSTSGQDVWENYGVDSVQLSPGCQSVKLYDDDYWPDDKTYTESESDLPYDLQDDLKGYRLTAKPAGAGCNSGYEETAGDISGWGTVNGVGGGVSVSSCNKCGNKCSDDIECLSYECSKTELKCNLNTQAEVGTEYQYKDYSFCVKDTWSTSEEGTLEQVTENKAATKSSEVNPNADPAALRPGKGTKIKMRKHLPPSGCWTCMPRKNGRPTQLDEYVWKGNGKKHIKECIARVDPGCRKHKKRVAKTAKKEKEDADLEKQTCKYCGWFHRSRPHVYLICRSQCMKTKKAKRGDLKKGPVSIREVDSVCPARCDKYPKRTPPIPRKPKHPVIPRKPRRMVKKTKKVTKKVRAKLGRI